MHHSILPCDFALPAEWVTTERHHAHAATLRNGLEAVSEQITNTYLQLADIITRYEDLLVVTPILESTQRMLAEKLSEGQMNRVHLYEMDTNDTWCATTDLSAWFRAADTIDIIPIHLLDFKLRMRREIRMEKGQCHQSRSSTIRGSLQCGAGEPPGLRARGRSIESDGKGTLFTTSQCLVLRLTATSLSPARTSTASLGISSM